MHLGIIFKDFPRRIYAVRKDSSSLIVAVGEDESFYSLRCTCNT